MQLRRTLPTNMTHRTRANREESASRVFQKRLGRAMAMMMMTTDHGMTANGALRHDINNNWVVKFLYVHGIWYSCCIFLLHMLIISPKLQEVSHPYRPLPHYRASSQPCIGDLYGEVEVPYGIWNRPSNGWTMEYWITQNFQVTWCLLMFLSTW